MKNISLKKWANRHFDPAPSMATLYKWATGRCIKPAPRMIANKWMVQENAEYSEPKNESNFKTGDSVVDNILNS